MSLEEVWRKRFIIEDAEGAGTVTSVPFVSFHNAYSSTVLERVEGLEEHAFVMALVHMTDKSYLMFLKTTDGEIQSAFDLAYDGHEKSSLALFQQWVDPVVASGTLH